MEARNLGMGRRAHIGAFWCALAILGVLLQECALYSELVQHGESLPLGESGAEWSPTVTTPAGGAVGVQIIHRF